MTYMVSMKDYEGFGGGFGGFASLDSNEVNEFQKALSAGYQSPRMDGGSALRVESLETTLRIVTFSQEHIKLWRDVPKLPAYSTSHEYNVQRNYGSESGMFTNEGEAPQVQDAAYERRVALLKFLGTQREVTHPMTLVRPAHGNVIALETKNGAVWLLERTERALFFGRSDVVPQAFDGFDQLLRTDSVYGQNSAVTAPNIIDLRGNAISQTDVEQASNIIVEAYGRPSDLYLAPRALSDIAKEFYSKERIMLPATNAGVVSSTVDAFKTQAGLIGAKSDIFLRSGKNNGVKKAPSAAQAVRAPTAPTIALATSTPATASLFGAADVGAAYNYKVSAVNRFGESAASASSSVTPAAAGDIVTITITDGGGGDTATGYRVYRTLLSGAAGTEQFLYEVGRVGTAATTVTIDTNRFLPGTSRAYMFQMNLQAVSIVQLAPMMKIPLATISAAIRWMQLMYLAPVLYAPGKLVIFDNVADD